MSKGKLLDTAAPTEKAFLIGVEIQGEEYLLGLEDSLIELELLAETAGLEVVGAITQRLKRANVKTLVGAGKVEEIKALADELEAGVVLFDDELIPRHQRELEKVFGEERRVIDRTALILDIFAQHANT
ncbi:MAG: GTPase HflX, partial [Anaerolineae bacterium]|nr:GTPase HflX [Anaerolineae bacterium]